MFIKTLAAIAVTFALALPAFAATPVNVNKADASTIADALDGIGMAKAQAIVAYREAHGPFKSVDDLGHVKGIGQATLERNREAIQLSDAGKKPAAEATGKVTHKGKKKGSQAEAAES
jgi:competence protein ComEA